MLFAPLEGWRRVEVTDRRTKADWARVVQQPVDADYPHKDRIVLVMVMVMDNLNPTTRPRCTRNLNRPKRGGCLSPPAALGRPLPPPSPGPAGNAFVDAFPVAVFCRQVFPLSAAAQDPQNTVQENPVVPGGYPHRPRTPWQKALCSPTLGCTDPVPFNPRPLTTRLTQSDTLPPQSKSLPRFCFLLSPNCRIAPACVSVRARARATAT